MEDAEYADDACLIAECLTRILELLEALAEESVKFGLKINTNKTKIMPIAKEKHIWPIIKHADKEIEVVEKFIYLGSEVKSEGGSDSEIKRRIALAGATFNRLQKIFKRHDIGIDIKLRIFNACVIPVLTYGCELWSVTKTMENRLNAAENKWLRRILKISYREHVTNIEVRRKTQQQTINDTIKKRRMRWAGHVLRMEDIRNPKRIFKYKPEGKRAIGRPKRRWIDYLDDDLKAGGFSIHGKTEGRKRMTLDELASDRELWRDVMEKSVTEHSRRMIT